MKKKLIIPLATIGVLAAGGIAWAALGGFVNVPDAIQGLATSGGPSSCQTNPITFTVPEPTWNPANANYEIPTIGFSGIDPLCVNNATTDLELQLVDGAQTVASATEANLTASTGTLTLTPAVPFDSINGLSFVYLVKG